MTPESASTSEVTQAVTTYLRSLPYTGMKAKQEQVDFVVINEAVGDIMKTLPYTIAPQEPTRQAVSVAVLESLQKHGIPVDPRDLRKPKEAYTVGDLSKPKPDEGEPQP